MVLATLASLFAALGLALLLLRVATPFLRRLGWRGGLGRDALPLEVVARLGLGPKQGLAVVRVGGRAIVVSVGDGGVRHLTELSPEEWTGLDETRRPDHVPGDGPLPQLSRRLRALRVLGLAALLTAAVAPASPNGVALAQAFDVEVPAASPDIDGAVRQLLPPMELTIGGEEEPALRLTGTVATALIIGVLTLLPTILLLMTSFLRILIVLHLLRQALGTQNTPPGHLIAGLALLLTGFVMAPTLHEINAAAIQPWMAGEVQEGEMLQASMVPLREFMVRQTSEKDLHAFLQMSQSPMPETPDDIPLIVLISAFATSELRVAFQMGFAIFLPFIVIDLVVASILTTMGMFMLPPTMIALPCKLLLFVLVDGWGLLVQSLITSFR